MTLVLHSYKTNKGAYKALIAAEYSGMQVKFDSNFEMGVTNKTREFLKMNPNGKVPVLQKPDCTIFESNAMARYVTRLKADNPLYGFSLIDFAHIEQWIDFASLDIDINIFNWLIPGLGWTAYLPQVDEAAISALKRALAALDSHLSSNTYLVGHSVTLADVVMICNLYFGFQLIMIMSFTPEFPHVERYFWTMVNHQNFKKILGEVNHAEAVPAVLSVVKPSNPKDSAEPKPKDEPKKAAKREVQKEPAKAAEEEEDAPKPKPKNPLDLLPLRK